MNILSFDIEEWFHLLDVKSTAGERQWNSFAPRIHANVERLLDSTVRHGHRATFFCLGWVAQRYPEIVRAIDNHGFEIGSHSHMHQLIYQQTPRQFREDLRRSVHTLEDITGKKVRSYRAPGFSFIRDTPWVVELLLEHGIERDSSIFPAARAHGGYDGFGKARPTLLATPYGTLKEFPINTGRLLGKNLVFSGGGYFRLLPYGVIQHLTRQTDYVMSYFHPRDFDQDQPRLDLPLHRHFKSYVGLTGAHAKFERWLGQNAFIDLATADKATHWNSAPVLEITARPPVGTAGLLRPSRA